MGHIMRCLAIAQKAISHGHDVLFIGNDIPLTFVDRIQNAGAEVENYSLLEILDSNSHLKHSSWLKGGVSADSKACSNAISKHYGIADWLLIDHYGIDIEWEKRLRDFTHYIAIIDDLADRNHDSDILLDQNIYNGWKDHYSKLTPMHCELLVGSSYILVRDEFISQSVAAIDDRCRDLLVFMGGGDEQNATGELLELLSNLEGLQDIKIDVILGPINPHKEHVERLVSQFPHGRLLVNPTNISELYSNVKVAIGAPGGSTWERCCLGVPSILIVIAENQKRVGQFLHEEGIALLAHSIAEAIEQYLRVKEDSVQLQHYADKAQHYVDGSGVERFISLLEKIYKKGINNVK